MSNKFKINPKMKMVVANTQQTIDPIAVVASQPASAEQYEAALKELHEEASLLSNLDDAGKYLSLTAYSAIYSKVAQQLQGIIKSVDSMRGFYLVEVMLSQIAEDALAPRVGSDDIIFYSSKNTKIQKELDDLKKRIGLDQLIENIAPDLLAYGEYTLATKIDGITETEHVDALGGAKKKFKKEKVGQGILDVTDIVDQGTVISLTQDGKTTGYLQLNERRGGIEVKEIADYIKFSLGGQRVRIDIKTVLPDAVWRNPLLKEVLDKIPRFLRIGKSVLYPVLSKLKELELLEKLIPATKLNKLSQGNLVGMNLPESYDLEKALKAVKKVEGMINKKVSVDPALKEITVEAILSTAGKTKIIPLLGEKGTLDKLDYKSDEPDDLMGSTKEIRELILDSVGVPSELVYKSDSDSKADILKRHAKYVRKLKRLQKALSDGCKQIAFIHLANKGIKFKEEDIEVNFLNTLVEIDNIDRLEHADITVSLLSNVRDFFNDMAEEDSPYKDSVNLDKVAEYIESNLKTVGLSDAINTAKEGGPGADKDALDVDGVDSQGQPTNQGEPEVTDAESDGEDEVKEE